MNPWALLLGWAAGMTSGTAMAAALGLKSSVFPLHIAGGVYAMYAAIPALALNLAVSAALTAALRLLKLDQHPPLKGSDATAPEAYVG